jgi:DNA-binding transcriptional ArsR family regulator
VKKIKPSIHPNAYLKNVRNVSKGLEARTKILQTLDQSPYSASRLAKEASLSYDVVTHHLRLLASEGVINRKGSRPYFWMPTGFGQKRLTG